MKDVYDDENALIKDLKNDIRKVLSKEVLDKAKEIELRHIDYDIFAFYTPQIYERRRQNGINDPDNIVGEIVEDMTLEIDNVTHFNDGYGTYNHGTGLADLINGGDSMTGFFYDYPGEFNQPRPFIDNTISEIEDTDQVDSALDEGMKNLGYDVK